LKKLLFVLLIFFASSALAIDYPYVLRSPQALLMGDAFTAVNDDEYTLFYNPASLGRHKADFTFYPFAGHLSGTNVLSDLNKFSNMPSTPEGISDLLMDYPVHASAGLASGFKLFNFGLSYIVSDSYDISLRNRTHPMLEMDLRSDRGVAMGLAIPLGPNRINKKSQSGSQTSLGLSAKYLRRQGIYDSIAVTGPTMSDGLGQGEVQQILNALGQVRGSGWGFDAGFEHIVRSGNSQFVIGLAALDITNTDFQIEGSNPNSLGVAPIRDQFNLGIAGGQDYKYFNYILSADVRGLNEQMDFGKRVRLGGKIAIPGLAVMGGLNSGYYSYGATIDLAFMKLTLGLYDIEIGSKYQQTKSKRFIAYLSLFDFSFDI
jgi:hypothetical protein